MKTDKIYMLIIFTIIGVFAFIYSCDEIKDTIDDYNSDDTCPEEIFADTITNQFIIKFEKLDNYDRQKPYLDRIRDSLKADSYEIETCDCDPKLVMVTFQSSTGIDMEKLRATAHSRLEDEGTGTYNYRFEQKVDGNVYSSTYYNKPTDIPSTPVKVAVIDGGINPEKFPGMPITEMSWDFTGESDASSKLDISSHGTYVSQIITEKIDFSNIRLMDLRIFTKDGKGSLFNGLCAISYAIQNNADIINMSWGGYFMDVDTLFLDYIREAKVNDITIVASAGNDTIDTDHCLHFPSGFNSAVFGTLGNVLGVASLNDAEDGLAKYSNYGPTTIGIAAVQGEIDGVIYEGTSFSAPVVTNHVVNMKLSDPSLTNVNIVNCITDSAIPVSGLKVISGGKLDSTVLVCP